MKIFRFSADKVYLTSLARLGPNGDKVKVLFYDVVSDYDWFLGPY